MKITDKEVAKIVRYINMAELTESLDTFPEEERNGKRDDEILVEEINWFLEWGYLSEGTVYYDDLERSREIIKKTKGGREIPCKVSEFWKLTPYYSESDIERAKHTISEFKRLSRGSVKAINLMLERKKRGGALK